MRIAVPRELKPLEGRVGLIPAACSELIRAGHEVYIERAAGALSGYADSAYTDVGAQLVEDTAAAYAKGELIVKVKEPIEEEWPYLRADHTLFGYLHLAANPELALALCEIGLTAIAFETVQQDSGGLPLLAPMSDIAGRLAIQLGVPLLHHPQGGKGILLGGLAGTERGRVTVIGAGSAGGNACRLAAALGAEVTVFDRKRERLEAMRDLGNNVNALLAYPDSVAESVIAADLVVGAVLIPGARAPHVITAQHIRAMQAGSVVIDISVDQGGCIETTRPTDYRDPTYVVDDVTHLAVTNMPGAVPRSASQALSAAVMPFLLTLAAGGLQQSVALQRGINVQQGRLAHPSLHG